MDAAKFLSKLGGRKFILSVFIFLTSTLFLVLGTLSKAEFVACCQLILSTYILSSIGQSFLTSSVKSKESETIIAAEESEILGRKFILSLFVFINAALLFYFKVLDAASYQSISFTVIGVYCAGNVIGKIGSLESLTTKKTQEEK